jgi:hypothetical protein
MSEMTKLLQETGLLAFASSDIGKKIFSPIADEAGKALGSFGEIYRFYQDEYLRSVFKKWGNNRHGKELCSDDLKKIMPLLQLASVQSEDELQDRWAALLENTVSGSQGVLPSFGQTLSQLTSEEARFLDRLFKVATQPQPYLAPHRPGMGPFSRVNLINIYDSSIHTGINPAEREFFKEQLSHEQVENYDKLTQAELVIRDLIRLGIIAEETAGEIDDYMPSEFGISPAGPFTRSPIHMESRYSLSHYGVSFIQAVAPMKPPAK